MAASLTIADLRRYALARSLFKPRSLRQAIERLGFVQADPIRSPARAQDLILRHRVKGYRAGDLERHYPHLPVEEDFFINHGFMPRELHALMHPRQGYRVWPKSKWDDAHRLIEFITAQGVVHPREVDAAMALGGARNFFGGNSRASTQLLDGLLYRGHLRVARREGGIRLFEVRPPWPEPADEAAAYDTLIDVAVAHYAPVPQSTLSMLVGRLLYGAPQWKAQRAAALARAKARLGRAVVEGITWYWPAGEQPSPKQHEVPEGVHLFAPFDPVVWDRVRFEHFWGWAYRFEAYTPAPKRERGYYAMPLMWQGEVIGWGNLSVRDTRAAGDACQRRQLSRSNASPDRGLQCEWGFVSGRAPRGPAFEQALEDERERLQAFLGL